MGERPFGKVRLVERSEKWIAELRGLEPSEREPLAPPCKRRSRENYGENFAAGTGPESVILVTVPSDEKSQKGRREGVSRSRESERDLQPLRLLSHAVRQLG